MPVEKRTVLLERFKTLLAGKKGIYHQKSLLQREDCPLGKDRIVDIYRERPIGVSSITAIAEWLKVQPGYLIDSEVISEIATDHRTANDQAPVPAHGIFQTSDAQLTSPAGKQVANFIIGIIGELEKANPQWMDNLYNAIRAVIDSSVSPQLKDQYRYEQGNPRPGNSFFIDCWVDEIAKQALVSAFLKDKLTHLGVYEIRFTTDSDQADLVETEIQSSHNSRIKTQQIKSHEGAASEWVLIRTLSPGEFVAANQAVYQDKTAIRRVSDLIQKIRNAKSEPQFQHTEVQRRLNEAIAALERLSVHSPLSHQGFLDLASRLDAAIDVSKGDLSGIIESDK